MIKLKAGCNKTVLDIISRQSKKPKLVKWQCSCDFIEYSYIKQSLVFGNSDSGTTQNVSGPKFHLPTMEYLVVIAFGRGIWS